MKNFYAVVHIEADSAFGISFPDLPGCFSAADEENEILIRAQEALALYAEGEGELPEPRSIVELRKDSEVGDDLAAGAFLVAVPVIEVARKSRYNVILDVALVEGVDKASKASGISRSEFLARAAREALARNLCTVVRHPKASKEAKTAAGSALTQKAGKKG